MGNIYVTGHKNPDTDSIVAAIAYANLKNSLGERDYKPVRIGSISDETKRILNRFGFEAPELVKNMRTQVEDIDFDRPPCLNGAVTMDYAWRTMTDCGTTVLPIVNEDGTLLGILSSGDIAAFDMESINDDRVTDLPIFNLLSVLEGTLVNCNYFVGDTVSGDVHIALPQSFDDPEISDTNGIIICGNQPEVVDGALAAGVNCVIICQADIDPKWASGHNNTCIISSPLDARRVARLVFQAKPVSSACTQRNPTCFHLSDYVDDVRELMLKNRLRAYPVLDENDKVVGMLTRYHLLRPRRKKVILVDHNELSQSVEGLDQAELLEIIDHHRLADIQTKQPIYVRNEPVGSTNTIITSMYQEYGVTPSPKLAGLICAAILSDTVLFKSPTCTDRDKAMAERLAKIAHVSIADLGKEIFSSNDSDCKSAEELIRNDFKQFKIQEQNIGIAQITCTDSAHVMLRKQELLESMEKMRTDGGYNILILMITDVLNEGTRLLYLANDEIMHEAFSAEAHDNEVYLPKVMSRKKQVVPMLTSIWS